MRHPDQVVHLTAPTASLDAATHADVGLLRPVPAVDAHLAGVGYERADQMLERVE